MASLLGAWENLTYTSVPPRKSTPKGIPCQKSMESTPATLNTSEKARKYHFFPRKSMFGLRKNSTSLKPLFECFKVSRFQCFKVGQRRLDPFFLETLQPLKLCNLYPILNASPRCLRPSTKSKITRDTNTAVNKFASRPNVSVTANPFSGPVPKMNRMKADTIVVTCVSTIVIHACANP